MSEGGFTYAYPRPMVVVDAVVFTVREGHLEVLLIKRGHAPFEGMWATPGGFVDMDEELETAAARELEEETGVTGVRLVQYHAFGGVERDPRGRVVGIAYLGIVSSEECSLRAGDDAADVTWMPVADLPRLASDHNLVVRTAVEYFRMLARSCTDDHGFFPSARLKQAFLDALGVLPEPGRIELPLERTQNPDA